MRFLRVLVTGTGIYSIRSQAWLSLAVFLVFGVVFSSWGSGCPSVPFGFGGVVGGLFLCMGLGRMDGGGVFSLLLFCWDVVGDKPCRSV